MTEFDNKAKAFVLRAVADTFPETEFWKMTMAGLREQADALDPPLAEPELSIATSKKDDGDWVFIKCGEKEAAFNISQMPGIIGATLWDYAVNMQKKGAVGGDAAPIRNILSFLEGYLSRADGPLESHVRTLQHQVKVWRKQYLRSE